MSASSQSLSPACTSQAAVRLMANVSANAIPAPNANAFGQALATALVDELAIAATVYLVHPHTGRAAGNRVASAGESDVIAETEMLSFADTQFSNKRDALAGGVTSRPVSETDARSWVIAWLYSAGELQGCVVSLIDQQNAATKIGVMQAIKLAAELSTRYFDHQVTPDPTASTAFHRSLDLKQTSHTVANELRRHMRSDRVSVFLAQGRRWKLKSVSGQARIHRRSNVIRTLKTLVQRTSLVGDPFCYPTETVQAPQIESALLAYLDQSHAASVCVVPIYELAPSSGGVASRKRRLLGALAFESFGTVNTDAESIVDSPLIEEAALSLTNAKSHSQIFLLPLWQSLGRGLGQHPIAKLVAAALVVSFLTAVLCLVQTDYYVHANGQLQPQQHQRLFASSDGIVGKIHVQHGQQVDQGETLLVIENAAMEQRLEKVLGELQIARQQLATLATMRLRAHSRLPDRETDPDSNPNATLASDQRQLEAQLANLAHQHELLKQQVTRLTVVAPISGEVVTWDVKRLLRSRPVNRGELLVTLEDIDGPWQLWLDLPESRIQALLDANRRSDHALPVRFVLGTDPNHYHHAQLTAIAESAQLHGQLGLSVKLQARIPDELQIERRVGAEVRAKIPCGRHALGYVLFHDAIDFVRARILFYLN